MKVNEDVNLRLQRGEKEGGRHSGEKSRGYKKEEKFKKWPTLGGLKQDIRQILEIVYYNNSLYI